MGKRIRLVKKSYMAKAKGVGIKKMTNKTRVPIKKNK